VLLKASRHFRAGRVIGHAERRPSLPDLYAVRPVEWEAREIPASSLAGDLRNALGSIMTVFRRGASGAQRRLESVIENGTDPGPDSGGDDRSAAWVFQANPKLFDLLGALDAGTSQTWAVNQHRPDVQPGDRVWFRLSGVAAGIYAAGRIMSIPRQETTEFANWQTDVSFDYRIGPPLLRPESDADTVLSRESALTGIMGTNLAPSAAADSRLEDLTEDRLIPVSGPEPAARRLEVRLNIDAQRVTERVELDLLEHLRSLTPQQTEDLCALYLRALGCDNVKVVGAAAAGSLGDGGIDVTGILAQPGLPAIRLAVQVKAKPPPDPRPSATG
jgi:restriction endonuclease